MRSDIREVAAVAGVSIATVSHVINNTRFVSEETKRKVYAAMDQLNYQPNTVARSLRNNKTNTFGLIVPILPSDTSNFFFMTIAQGIQSKIKEHGYHLILSANTTESIEDEKEQIRLFNSRQIDGLFIASISEEPEYLNEVKGKYPIVFIDRRARGYSADSVTADGYNGAYRAVTTLIEKGHRNIGLITGGLGISTSDERFNGYRKALENHGIPYDEDKVVVASSNFESGYNGAKKLISEQNITAMFIANNVLTMGAICYLQGAKIRIPEEMAVIGFDDYDWTRITDPPLSVIRQPSFEMGERAAEAMLARINQPDGEYVEHCLDTELIIRGSC